MTWVDVSTSENSLPWDLDYNSIRNTNILGGADENFPTSKLLLLILSFLKISPNKLNTATELALSWSYVAITKIKQLMVVQGYLLSILVQFKVHYNTSHRSTRRRSDIVTTSLCTSQWRRRYVSDETPNDVSMEGCQDGSVVRLHDVLLERRDDVWRGRNNDVPSVRLHNVSDKSQMKHPATSRLYVTKTSHWYVSATSVPSVRLCDVSNKSQMKHPITSLWYASTTSRSYGIATLC